MVGVDMMTKGTFQLVAGPTTPASICIKTITAEEHGKSF
jgi:hypothetical protein